MARIREAKCFNIEDIDLVTETWQSAGEAPGSDWEAFKGARLILPDWFQPNLDPLSSEYLSQQKRLWCELAATDREYDPQTDEGAHPPKSNDTLRFPGYYSRRDPLALENASNHIIATGMILKHSGLKSGSWALEYGAGFGQPALTLARLGVNVDTVDICPVQCRNIKAQADFYRINLSPHEGSFGLNPRGEQHKYDLIYFYESFHHCLDFSDVIKEIKKFLNPAGRILLAGEPITPSGTVFVPYPWGLRLAASVVAVIRQKRWFELGFQEDFLANLFTNFGFAAQRYECAVSDWGTTYVFDFRKRRIDLSTQWLPHADACTWHLPERNGRWTKDKSTIALDSTETFSALIASATNHHSVEQVVLIDYGGRIYKETFRPGEQKNIRIPAPVKSSKITFECRTTVSGAKDPRALGIFIHEIEYVE